MNNDLFDDLSRSSRNPAASPSPPPTIPSTSPDSTWLNESTTVPLRINSIRVEGVKNTRSSVIQEVVAPALQAKSFDEVTKRLHQACGRLEQLEIMDGFEIAMDMAHGPLVPEHSVDVVIHAREKGRFWARTGTEIGNSEGSAHTSANFRNLFGGGETLSISGSVGTRTRASHQATLTTPINADPNQRFDLAVYQQNQTFQASSSHEQLFRGVNLRYTGAFPGLHTEMGYSAVWRQIREVGFRASPSVRLEAGHSLKSGVYFSMLQDRRDNPTLPTRGYMWKWYSELAGLGGDVRFLKNEGQTQYSLPLGRGFALSHTTRAGLLQPLQNDTTRISDRFFLGGPNSLRGFRPFGVGPRDQRDALGGDFYWSSGLSLLTPLPNIDSENLKGHLWANAGGLAQLNANTPLHQSVRESLCRPTSSVGLGLLFQYSMVRLELNFCLPLTMSLWDHAKKGWQFGMGIDFL
ncbi:hypothetical protein IWQ61_006514 [Dispira simplex]|nr:hypothetical protein IWQ61_006514 [Dispira simplex]